MAYTVENFKSKKPPDRDRMAKKYAKQFSGGRRFGSLREYAEADYSQGWDDALAAQKDALVTKEHN